MTSGPSYDDLCPALLFSFKTACKWQPDTHSSPHSHIYFLLIEYTLKNYCRWREKQYTSKEVDQATTPHPAPYQAASSLCMVVNMPLIFKPRLDNYIPSEINYLCGLLTKYVHYTCVTKTKYEIDCRAQKSQPEWICHIRRYRRWNAPFEIFA